MSIVGKLDRSTFPFLLSEKHRPNQRETATPGSTVRVARVTGLRPTKNGRCFQDQ